MKLKAFTRRLLGATLISACGGPALASTQSYIDLEAGAGYSTNPLLQVGNNTGSAFGRLSAYAYHGWSSERGKTDLSAYVENTSYLHRYNNKQVFSLAATTNQAVSETVRVFGSLGFTGDIGGQLSSRFYGVPTGGPSVDPSVPVPPVIVNPDLYSLDQRQYTLSGQLGTNITLSARDSLGASASAQHVFVSKSNDLDYTQYDGSLSYDHQLNERVTVGGRMIAQYADYSSGRAITTIGPQATVTAQFSEGWRATAALGVVRTHEDEGSGGGSHSSFDLAADGSICRELQYDRMCLTAARRTQSSVLGSSPTSTSVAFDYYRQLSAKNTIQFTASVVRSDSFTGFTDDDDFDNNQRSTYYLASGSFNRQISDRLSAGVNVSARKLTTTGPNPNGDFGGSVFIRYRLGQVR